MNKFNYDYKMRLLTICLSIFTILSKLFPELDKIFFNKNIYKIFYFLLLILIIITAYDKHLYLPFLGNTIIPFNLFKPIDNTINIDSKFTKLSNIVDATDAYYVIWWASEPSDIINNSQNPEEAYKDYKNSGVIKPVNNKAEINVYCPNQYTARGNILDKHVHYRLVYKNGIVSEVKTLKLLC